MTQEEYQNAFSEDDAVGWWSIDEHLQKIYGQTEPRHYPAPLHYAAGGTDPLDGVSIYDSPRQPFHRHLISYGMSQLYYDEEKAGSEFSNWGFEFTFRLQPYVQDKGDPFWAIQVMNNLARYVFNSGRWFEEYHFLPAKGPIRLETDTDIVGVVFVLDPELGRISTPHGEVSFLQMVGITQKELDRLLANPTLGESEKLINELRVNNPLLITDLNRK